MSGKSGKSGKSVTFNTNIHFISSSTETPKKEATIAELLRVIDNSIKKIYQKNEDMDYLKKLRSKSSDLLVRLKTILPENVNLPNVIEFIIFVIKKYYTGINGLRGMKSNSRKGRSIFLYMISNSREERSILLYCLDYLFGINNVDLRIILNQMFHYTEGELHSKNKRYSMEKRKTFKTCSAADIILLIFSTDSELCAKLCNNNKYEVKYGTSDRKRITFLCSDLKMGGLLNLSDENNDKITVVENTVENTVENKLVENKLVRDTLVENKGEKIEDIVKDTPVENKLVGDTVENTVENTDENTDENTLVENTVEEIVKDIVKDIVENTVENTDENTDKNTLVENTSNENKGFVKPTLILVCVVLVLIRSIPFIFK